MKPPLSVVFSTSLPWPEARATVESLADQVARLGVEVIVAGGSEEPFPEGLSDRYPGFRFLNLPGRQSFDLRGAAMAVATADRIALTEDHVDAPQDWCERLINAHRAAPLVPLIYGPVANGSTRRASDWANHFLIFGPLVPPIGSAEEPPEPSAANVAVLKSHLPSEVSERGFPEYLLLRDLYRMGGARFDPAIVIEHTQPTSLAGGCRSHYFNGRALASRRHLSRSGRMVSFVACAALPAYLVGRRVWQLLVKRPLRWQLGAALPSIGVFAIAHAVGEAAGYALGPSRFTGLPR